MLYTIHRGNVEGYSEGQLPVLHLVTSVEKVVENCSGPLKLDSRERENYSSELGDQS
jgi:hypothetical protein